MRDIRENDFGQNLLDKLINLKYSKSIDETFNYSTDVTIFIKLCEVKLENYHEIEFTEDEKLRINYIDIYTLTNNSELIARLSDFKQLNNIDRYESSILAYKSYHKIYTESRIIKYYIRAIEVVKSRKGIFDNKNLTPDVISNTEQVILDVDNPHDLKRILEIHKSIDSLKKVQEKYKTYINNKLNFYLKSNSFTDAIEYVECLKTIECLTNKESRIQKARIYELDGDLQVQNKEINVCYIDLPETYLKALHELQPLPDCRETKNRIGLKYLREANEIIRMMSQIKRARFNNVDLGKIYKHISKLLITDLNSVIEQLLSLPFFNNNYLTKNIKKEKTSTWNLFARKEVLTAKGTVQGRSEGDKIIEENLRMLYRTQLIIYIMLIRDRLTTFHKVSFEEILYMIENQKSHFIPPGREYLFAKGIYYGFINDYISASHILVPQIENSLKEIALSNNVVISKLENNLQHDNTLGGVLEKMKEFIDLELLSELDDFLVSNSGDNFRNNLSHGLLDPLEIQFKGCYSWWLSIKMVFLTEKLFRQDN